MVSLVRNNFRYLSTLYSHPDFTYKPHLSHKIKEEIRGCVERHWQVHLSPPWSSKYLRKIISKSVNGQPVSFTDFYGYLVGQQLLKGVIGTGNNFCVCGPIFKILFFLAEDEGKTVRSSQKDFWRTSSYANVHLLTCEIKCVCKSIPGMLPLVMSLLKHHLPFKHWS